MTSRGDYQQSVEQDETDDGRRASHQLRDILARNGFQFIKRAAAELGENAAEASIHLCSGIELLMKARLAHEHWSLVDSNPGARTLQTLHSGDFVSVSFDDAVQRLGAVASANFKPVERDVLEKAKTHRNRVVHFFHRDMDKETGRQEAAIELCRAWGIFEKRIRGKWKDAFPVAPLDDLHDQLKRLQPYLQARYKDAKHKLTGLKAAGRVERCRICNFESSVFEVGDFQITDFKCQVCGTSGDFLLFACPECKTDMHLESEIASADCPNEECNLNFDLADICNQIGVETEPAAFCNGCYLFQRTAYFKPDYSEGICLSCLQAYDCPPMECGQCGEPWVGKDEEDLAFGCPECYGPKSG